jgi:intraflagellar transport protein 172
MQLKHFKNVLPASPGVAKVTAVAWAPNNMRLAVVTADRVVHLIDENGERRDKFATKQGDPKNPKNYVVTAMAFSPDSTKLAIAQSDCIVFVYKLGLEWTDKKSISNKFGNATGVSALCWPSAAGGHLVFGGADGRVRLGQMTENRPATLFASNSYVVSLTASPAGNAVLSGHADGSVYLTLLEHLTTSGEVPAVKLFTHSCPPTGLAWGSAICAAGCDARVSFYDVEGTPLRTFDYSGDPSVKAFTTCVASPTGEAVVVGNFNKFMVYALEGGSTGTPSTGGGVAAIPPEWREVAVKHVEGLYTVTSLGWKADGSKVALGSLCGAVDLYDACLRRVRYQGKFDFTYVSPSTVIVKRLSSGRRIVLRSSLNHEIRRIRIYRDRYLIATTARTLLAGDLESCRLSEVPWESLGDESDPLTRPRFYFESPSVAMVYRSGELTLIEYGRTEVLGQCRTEYLSPHTVSVRIEELPPALLNLLAEGAAGSPTAATSGLAGRLLPTPINGMVKVFAYLLDAATIRVLDLNTGVTLATISHDSKIDWLELNPRGNMLLFRDKKHRLHLYDCSRQTRSTLLPYCNYAQWVPESDVVVAQRRSTLCVWYSILNPDRVTHYDIKGDVEEIVRQGGKTEVIVDEGMATASYLLDEGLIAFGGAMEMGDFAAAMATLEGLELTPETTGMWTQLGDAALVAGDLKVAERVAVSLGDVARARWLRRTSKTAAVVAESAFLMGGGATDAAGGAGGAGAINSHWKVRVPLLQLRGEFQSAEAALLEQGKPEEAVQMYRGLQEWEEALAVAESHGLPEADALKTQVLEFLSTTGQEDRAAAIKEREGDLPSAVALYLRGGYPAKAAALVASHPSAFPRQLLERVTSELAAAGMYSRAGALMERLGDPSGALESYVRGNAWKQAVDLARKHAPARVVEFEKQWGDYLMQQRQPEAAVARYIEARAHTDAINAAIAAMQFQRAAELVSDTLGSDPVQAKPFWKRLASAALARGQYDQAEKFYLQAGEGRSAVTMYLGHGKPDAAYRVAKAVMPEADIQQLFTQEATKLEAMAGGSGVAATNNLRQAEKLLLAIGSVDGAIAMYTRHKAWDSVVRLAAAHRPAKVKDTRLQVAQACAADGLYKQAESAYVDAGEWESAVSMYRGHSMWEDALRVARSHGGPQAAARVAYAQALSLGPEAGMSLLKRLGLVEQAIDFAVECRLWDVALDLAARHATAPHDKVLAVHLKHAMALEDEGSFQAAEAAFVAAGKPREAVDMWLHLKDWNAAIRVAEAANDTQALQDITIAQAHHAATNDRDYATAEALYCSDDAGKRAELAIDMYLQARMVPDALRVTKKHLPHRLPEVTDRIQKGGGGGGGGSIGGGAAGSSSSPSNFRDPATRRAAASAGATYNYSSSPQHQQQQTNTKLTAGNQGRSPRSRAALLQQQQEDASPAASSPLSTSGGGHGRPSGRDRNSGGAHLSSAASSPRDHNDGGGSQEDSSSSVSAIDTSDPLAMARLCESQRDWALAIDCYLKVGTEEDLAGARESAAAGGGSGGQQHYQRDMSTCKLAWLRAVQLASSKDVGARGRQHYDVCEDVANRFMDAALDDVAYYHDAAMLFESIEQWDHAAEAYTQAKDWNKARQAARNAPSRMVREQVERAYQREMQAQEEKESKEALQALEKELKEMQDSKQPMEKILEVAANKNAPSTLLARYIYPYISDNLLAKGQVKEAIAALHRYGAPAVATALPVYRRIVLSAFNSGTYTTPSAALPDESWLQLKQVLYRVSAAMRKQQASGGAASSDEFDKLLLPVHYQALRIRLTNGDLASAPAAPPAGPSPQLVLLELAAKLSMSLLRFAGSLIPVDKAFYEAGTACQKMAAALSSSAAASSVANAAAQAASWRSAAYVLLNRYVDVCDSIDEHEEGGGSAASSKNGKKGGLFGFGGGKGKEQAATASKPSGGGVDLSSLDNRDFVGTGIPPPNEFNSVSSGILPMPALKSHWLDSKAARDDIRKWVLETSVEASGKAGGGSSSTTAGGKPAAFELPKRPCFSCGEAIFEGSLGCPHCKAVFPACVVSGYPIPASQLTTCSACSSKANKQAWQAVVGRVKSCPWCSSGTNGTA